MKAAKFFSKVAVILAISSASFAQCSRMSGVSLTKRTVAAKTNSSTVQSAIAGQR